jgi:hypothetical protein
MRLLNVKIHRKTFKFNMLLVKKMGEVTTPHPTTQNLKVNFYEDHKPTNQLEEFYDQL